VSRDRGDKEAALSGYENSDFYLCWFSCLAFVLFMLTPYPRAVDICRRNWLLEVLCDMLLPGYYASVLVLFVFRS
jgi:hypothetical protein